MLEKRFIPKLSVTFYEKSKQQGGIGLIGDSRRAKQVWVVVVSLGIVVEPNRFSCLE